MHNALRPAVEASAEPAGAYAVQLLRPPIGEDDRTLASRMLGRPLRGSTAVAVRCGWGLPAVLRVSPRLGDGTPFPTLFWLSCPLARRHVGRLESNGVMAQLSQRLDDDPALAAAYGQASDRYVAARDALGGPVPRNDSAGGMPDRVKCLHSLYAHHLATGDNPIGAEVAALVEPMTCSSPCVPAEGPSSDRGEDVVPGPP